MCTVLLSHKSFLLGNAQTSQWSIKDQNEEVYQIERRIADEIMETVHRLQLPLKLDQLTEGKGNCFPISISIA